MSAWLGTHGVEHVVLERGEIANAWRHERWDSLRLLTPNWQSRLPGHGYVGADPDGFRTTPETICFLDSYAHAISAPVQTHTRVTSLSQTDDGYALKTTEGDWQCRTVVIASGACNIAKAPAFADAVPSNVRTLTAMQYKNPRQLEPGGVLVVGASATGTQLAEEIHTAGHPVTLSVGEHIRAPRTYRGKDIQWWMDKAGVLGEHYKEVDDINRARRVPSLQLTGSPERSTLDLNTLTAHGVKLAGPLSTIRDGKALFSGSLANQCALSDLKLGRLLDAIDQWATANGLDAEVPPAYRLEPTRVEASPPLGLDLASGEIRTIIWAAGFRPDYSWLDVPVLDRKGLIRHDGGVVPSPGMYLMGMPFLRRRKSALIDGAGDDARDLSAHLETYLAAARPG
jgi:putative flavoprotein involved in K+ transport